MVSRVLVFKASSPSHSPSPFHVSLSFAPNWGEGFKSFADVAHLSLSSSTPDEEDEDVELEGFEGQLQWVEGMHF